MCGMCSAGTIHERFANDPFVQVVYQSFKDYAQVDRRFRYVLRQNGYQNYSSFVGTVQEQVTNNNHIVSCEEPDRCFLNALKEAFGTLISFFVYERLLVRGAVCYLEDDPFIQAVNQSISDYSRANKNFGEFLRDNYEVDRKTVSFHAVEDQVMDQNPVASGEEFNTLFLNAFKEAFSIRISAIIDHRHHEG